MNFLRHSRSVLDYNVVSPIRIPGSGDLHTPLVVTTGISVFSPEQEVLKEAERRKLHNPMIVAWNPKEQGRSIEAFRAEADENKRFVFLQTVSSPDKKEVAALFYQIGATPAQDRIEVMDAASLKRTRDFYASEMENFQEQNGGNLYEGLWLKSDALRQGAVAIQEAVQAAESKKPHLEFVFRVLGTIRIGGTGNPIVPLLMIGEDASSDDFAAIGSLKKIGINLPKGHEGLVLPWSILQRKGHPDKYRPKISAKRKTPERTKCNDKLPRARVTEAFNSQRAGHEGAGKKCKAKAPKGLALKVAHAPRHASTAADLARIRHTKRLAVSITFSNGSHLYPMVAFAALAAKREDDEAIVANATDVRNERKFYEAAIADPATSRRKRAHFKRNLKELGHASDMLKEHRLRHGAVSVLAH